MKKMPWALLVLLCSGSLSFAGNDSKPLNLIVTIAAEDKSHNPVSDLKPEEISVKDNDAPVIPSSMVYAGKEPKDWILAIDASGSMRHEPLWQPAVEAAVKQLSSLMRERGDRVAVINMQNEAYLDQTLTSDEGAVRRGVDRAQPRGGTALYDGLTASADYLAHQRQQGRQQVIWVISDGGENSSRLNLREAMDHISGTGVPILFSLIGDEPRGMKTAQHLTKISGGSIFKLKHIDKCEEEAKKLVAFAENEYVIAFSAASDKATHDIRVATTRAGVNLLDHDRSIVTGNPAK